MLENGDQRFWTEKLLDLVDEKRPDAIVIAGDVYDRSAPSGEAVQLLDYLLTSLAERGIPVMMIAGNHDSGQRLSFARKLLEKSSIHISGSLGERGEMEHITLSDEFGPVDFWLCPYIFPTLVAEKLGDETVRDYDTAMRRLVEVQKIDTSHRNVLVAHQFVTANGEEATFGGSESMVGGVGQIDCSAFDCFDYVALGHIHSSYSVGRQSVRYAGSPLCYHLNETRQREKGPLLVDLKEKGESMTIETQVIEPLHRMRYLVGTNDEIRKMEKDSTARDEYIGIQLTDTRITPEISTYFHELYRARGSILMVLTSSFSSVGQDVDMDRRKVESRSLEDLFADFLHDREGEELEEDEVKVLHAASAFLQSSEGRDFSDTEGIENFLGQLEKEVRA